MTGTNVGTAYLEVVPSAKGFAGKLQSQVGGDMASAGRQAGERYAGGFGGGLKKLAGAAAGLVVFDQVKDFIGDSIGAASDLNETINKSTVIFGGNAKAIERWAEGSDRSLGLSKQSALDAAASFGDMFTQLGLGGDKAASMSKGVVQLAADLGSFNNLGTEDVLERLAGGFRGEYDALQKVIPNISAARVEQQALAMTHKKAAKDLTAAEKATATLAIVQKDGARAAGDFARTSDGLANSQKIQAAEMENLRAKIGTGLLPIQLKVTRFIADKAVPAISDFVGGMQDGTGAGGEFAEILRDVGEDLKDLYEAGKNVVEFVDGLPGPVKKFAVEGAIALVVLNKLGLGFSRVGTSSIGQFVGGMARAETRMETTRKAALRLGGALRQGAGAAGAVALANGLKKTSDESSNAEEAMKALNVVAGATAIGFAVGGPLGGGIGAVAGTVTALVKNFDLLGRNQPKVNQAFKVSTATLRTYRGTLDGVSAAITSQTRAAVLQELQEKGLLEATRKLGLSDREAINAMTGQAAARRKLSTLLSSSTALTNKQKDALRTETGAVAASRLAQLKHNVAIASNATELKKAKTALAEFMKAPASKRVSITGTEDVITNLHNIRDALKQVMGLGSPELTSGRGGYEVLIDPRRPEGAGATGAIVRRPTVALIGEAGPEALVPLNRTAGNSPLPPAAAWGSSSLAGQRLALIVGGRVIEGVIEDIADTRVGAQRGLDGQQRRAFG